MSMRSYRRTCGRGFAIGSEGGLSTGLCVKARKRRNKVLHPDLADTQKAQRVLMHEITLLRDLRSCSHPEQGG
jgi:hypothetical protein